MGTRKNLRSNSSVKKGMTPRYPRNNSTTLVTLKSQANQGLLDHAAYWDEFLSMRGVPDPVQRRQLTSEIENYSNNVLPIPGVRETLQELKIMAICWESSQIPCIHSNGKCGASKRWGSLTCWISSPAPLILGAHKPDPAIYSHALKQASLSPSEAVFVGHLGIELQGAHAAGMVTISIDPALEEKADYRCRSLPEVLTLPILQGTSAAPLR